MQPWHHWIWDLGSGYRGLHRDVTSTLENQLEKNMENEFMETGGLIRMQRIQGLGFRVEGFGVKA